MNEEEDCERKEELRENVADGNALVFFEALEKPGAINNGREKINSQNALEERIFAKKKRVCYIARN